MLKTVKGTTTWDTSMMETNSNQGSPRMYRRSLVDVTKTQAFKEIYAQRLRSYGMLYAKELSGSGSIAKDSNDNVIKRFRDHKKHRSVSDPNINLIRTLSIRNSGNFSQKKSYRTSMSDTMLQETLRRRIHSASDSYNSELSETVAHRSMLDLRNTEIPEEGTQPPRLQKRYSLMPNISRYIEQRLEKRPSFRSDSRRHSSLAYIDCTTTNVSEALSTCSGDKRDGSCDGLHLCQSKPKFNKDNNPRLQEAKFRTQKRYASIKSLEMDIMKADEFIARVKRQCSSDKRQ